MTRRIIWCLIVLIATITALVLLLISWQWNLETPTITVIESTHYPISNVYFPAITICNMNKISAKRALEMATNMTRPNGISAVQLSKMFKLLLHFHGIGDANKTEYNQLHSIFQTNNISVLNLINYLTPRCDEMLNACQWKGSIVRCDTLYQAINTIEGLCCSFNYYGQAKSNFPP